MPEKRNLPAKPELRHGIYSWVNSKKVPSGRAFQAIRRELGALREELVEAHGGPQISPDRRILVDSTIEALGVQKLLGLYVRKYGVVDGQAAKRGRLELTPILAKNWISYGNTVRQGILALRELDMRKPAEPPITLAEIIREHDEAARSQDAADDQGAAEIGAPGATQSEEHASQGQEEADHADA